MKSTIPNLLSFIIIVVINTTTTATATPLPGEALPTKSGYLPVDQATTSAMFYAFYEAQNLTSPISETPLLIWLQGGPGCSSLLGNFFELGPFLVSQRQNAEHPLLTPNPSSWNRLFGLIFLDNPIGTGFSIASTTQQIPRDQTTVAKHLFAAISGFIASNPSFKLRPLYITGESYAGKYVPAIGYYILKRNQQSPESRRINLAGVAIGNGLTDPVTQVGTHAVNAYFTGLINEKQKTQLEKLQLEAVALTKSGNWRNATDARLRVLNTLQEMTGLATMYDLRRKTPYETHLVSKLLKDVEVKKGLGVNASIVWEDCSGTVGEALYEDVMKSVKYMVEFLVRETKVLLYQGQFDLRDGVVSTEAWVKKMKWDGIDNFMEAERKVWKVNGEVGGYVQRWGGLSEVVLLGAGHLVPADQGVHSQAMIEDWVLERGVFRSSEEESLGVKSRFLL